MLWARDTPAVEQRDDRGRTTKVTVVAGAFDGLVPPAPPPDSYAARADADVAIWYVACGAGASSSLPVARGGESTVRVLYVYEGSVTVGGTDVSAPTAVVVRADAVARLVAGDRGAQVLVLQGRPIGEPVAQHGPFVMNDEAGIRQAFADYQRTGFGGWPWSSDDPVHGPAERGRFARHADGHEEELVDEPVS
jgi:redox-sensitive bicupin YhaK (pirin superfamily)